MDAPIEEPKITDAQEGQSGGEGEQLTPRGIAAMQGTSEGPVDGQPAGPGDPPPVDQKLPAGQAGLDTNLQADEGIHQLSQIREIQPEAWQSLEEPERLNALQQVENTMADIQNRPQVPVLSESLGPKSFGYYDGNSIHVSSDVMMTDDVAENVDTVVHEGRHAYQQYAMDHPGFHSNAAEVDAWRDNQANYLSAEMYGQEIYQSQPLEADAWSYAASIRRGLYG